MIKLIISSVLLLTSVFLSFKHGWDAFQPANSEQAKLMSELGITKTIMPLFGVSSIIVGLMLLFPPTFFIGNLLNAMTIVIIMALSLRAGNITMALIEIPFLLIPLLLIYLGHPLKKQQK